MLNIEIIKFEAQDVITTSGVMAVMPECTATGGAHETAQVTVKDGVITMVCPACEQSVSSDTGIVGG